MICISNISKTLGEFHLDKINLEINEGEYFVIIGPTGSGKTILLETIAGIYTPDEGDITLNKISLTNLPPRDRNISMVYQDFMLFPHMTVEQNIGFGLKNKKTDPEVIKKRVLEITEIFGISHLLNRHPGTLSGGEKQRASICRAVLMDPVLLLLDEPLSALDSRTRELLRSELKKFHGMYKTTILHITHNYEEVFSLADRVALMHDGVILQIGTPESLFERPKTEFIAEFVGFENLYEGKIILKDEAFFADVSGVCLKCNLSKRPESGEKVNISIRSENIRIYKEPIPGNDNNLVSCKITDICDMGSFVKISADAGFIIKSLMMKKDFVSEGPGIGDKAYACFSRDSVHVITQMV